jgi:acetyl-CoA carboxylase biotin carboxylase subunit
MFRRLLVANRGEVAARILRACREMGIGTVAVHSIADAGAPWLRLADETVCIGPAQAAASYLDMEGIIQAAEQTGCAALHPGFGFLSENALFAARVQQHRIAWVGPPPRAIARMGDKAEAKRTMQAAGLDTIPGTEGILPGLDAAEGAASEVGYPVLLKATAGGGGRGMRRCEDAADLRRAFPEASLEAEKAFGDAGLYLEKAIEGARHVEFQVLADHHGNAVHLGERDCSLQRRHQKVLEEAPSPVIDAAAREATGRRVAEAARAIGYASAGTVEFLRDGAGRMYFMEMNTRLQVEHPITEMITGVDIVQEQIRIAGNEALSLRQREVSLSGHAIEFRVNAEDPDDDFRPDPGRIDAFDPPTGDGVRVDTHVEPGYEIPPFYDSMIAKLVVAGADRDEAIARAVAALDAFRVEGVETTLPLHRRILAHPEFRAGRYDTRWLERLLEVEGALSPSPAGE